MTFAGSNILRARDYDPTTGQFLTRDPLEDVSSRPYLYAGGDPVDSIDPLGLFPSPSELLMGISEGAAALLDGASGGIGTDIAGSSGRAAEQGAINREGGVDALDNKRNEVQPDRWNELGIDP